VVADFGGGSNEPDGLKDLYLGMPVATQNFLFLARSGGVESMQNRHFVKVRLASIATTDNAMGIGSVVTINAGEQSQVQVVDGGSMRGGQADRNLHFGLGAYDGPVSATVNWPSGLVQPEVPLLLDQLNLIENTAVVVDDATLVGKYKVQASGLVDWEFAWKTNAAGDPALDTVIFQTAGLPAQCLPELDSIKLGVDDDVSLTCNVSLSGGYSHVLTWANRTCVPTCQIPFKVSSGLAAQADTSDVTANLRIRICID